MLGPHNNLAIAATAEGAGAGAPLEGSTAAGDAWGTGALFASSMLSTGGAVAAAVGLAARLATGFAAIGCAGAAGSRWRGSRILASLLSEEHSRR